MNTFTTAGLALAAVLMLPATALAQEGGADGKAGSVSVQGLSGRPIDDGFGIGLPPVSGNMTLTGGQPGPGSVGWQPLESLRVELEYAQRNGSRAMPLDLGSGDGTLASRSLMANAMIDLRVSDWLTPYVGFGVGMARIAPDATGAPSLSARSGDAVAYQGIVGLSVPFSDSLSFFADGRYQRTDDFSLLPSTSVDHSLQTWSALAGLRFTFGGGGGK